MHLFLAISKHHDQRGVEKRKYYTYMSCIKSQYFTRKLMIFRRESYKPDLGS